MKFIHPYRDRDPDRMSALTVLVTGKGKTQQQFRDDADINVIMERFGQGRNILPEYRTPISGDYTDVVDFQTAMESVREARENFMMLPASLRHRFGNSPQALLDFVSDDRNYEEARRLGLLRDQSILDATGPGDTVKVSPPPPPTPTQPRGEQHETLSGK